MSGDADPLANDLRVWHRQTRIEGRWLIHKRANDE